MSIYSKEVMKHFKTPQNVGKMKKPDALGRAGNVRCGDLMYFYLKISKDKKGRDIIKDVKFETYGCTIAIANTSLLSTMIKGKTLKEALKVTKEDLVKKFGNVPLIKIHCSLHTQLKLLYNHHHLNHIVFHQDFRVQNIPRLAFEEFTELVQHLQRRVVRLPVCHFPDGQVRNADLLGELRLLGMVKIIRDMNKF